MKSPEKKTLPPRSVASDALNALPSSEEIAAEGLLKNFKCTAAAEIKTGATALAT